MRLPQGPGGMIDLAKREHKIRKCKKKKKAGKRRKKVLKRGEFGPLERWYLV